jgi:hypothetical protein
VSHASVPATALSLARPRFRRLIFRHIAAPDAQFAKAPGRFSFQPLVYSALSPLQGSNNVIPKSFTCAWIMWKQCSLDVPHNVIPSERNPNLADPPDLWVIIPFRFGTPYWTAIGQSTCRSVFEATCPINETSVGNDDPNQPYTSLAVCAKWLVLDRHAIHAPFARVT